MTEQSLLNSAVRVEMKGRVDGWGWGYSLEIVKRTSTKSAYITDVLTKFQSIFLVKFHTKEREGNNNK